MSKTLKGGLVMAVTAGSIVLGWAGSAVADEGTAPAKPAADSSDTEYEGWATIDDDTDEPTITKVVSRGGGTWDYGSNRAQGYGWSDYYHKKNCHGSSAKSGRFYIKDHGIRAGSWSKVTITRDGKIRAYWTNRC